jgi:hypothetical protein
MLELDKHVRANVKTWEGRVGLTKALGSDVVGVVNFIWSPFSALSDLSQVHSRKSQGENKQ